MTATRAHCYAVLARAVKPRDRLTVSGWADRHRILSGKQSGERGRWRTDRNPILREIMDSLSVFSPVREVVVMKSSQVGVTEACVNWLGYIIDHAPAPAMVLMPTLESRDNWKAQKFNPLLTDTAAVRDILGGMKSRDAANSKDMVDFPGGILFLAGGNSPNSYAQKSARNVIMDDLDRFPSEIGEEGDPVALARGRTKSFPRSKLLLISTPTVKGASLIEREYEASDQRHYQVPCPSCGEFQPLRWANLKIDPVNRPPTWARYACEHCGHELEEHHKPKMLAGGRWIAEQPEKSRRGYHISALYAPIGLGPSWLDLAEEFLTAKDDPVTLKTFINTHLGESWEDQTGKLKPNELARRIEANELRAVPPGCLVLTAGIDTQDDWLAVTLLGWGEGHLWVIDWVEILGDTAKPEVWDRLQDYLHSKLVNAWGKTLRIRAAGIDSRGHRSDQVRAFTLRPGLELPVYAVQGATTRMGRAIAQQASYPDKNRKGKVVRGGYGLWNVGTEYCKDFIYGHLASDGDKPETERQFRFPTGLEETYFNGLLAEAYDVEKKRYIQRTGAKFKRNEPLDTLVYAWAIGQHKEVNIGRGRNGRPDAKYWERLGAVLEGEFVRVEEKADKMSGQNDLAEAIPASCPQPVGLAMNRWNNGR